MPDMLVHLLNLPPATPLLDQLKGKGIHVRRAQPFEQTAVRRFVESAFAVTWADEISVAYARQPVSLYIATKEGEVVGFAAYECTRRGFFGPMGVATPLRGSGVGKALLVAGLTGLAEMGYVYGIIGGVGPIEFYEKGVGAMAIPDSTPGIYTDLLKKPGGAEGAAAPHTPPSR